MLVSAPNCSERILHQDQRTRQFRQETAWRAESRKVSDIPVPIGATLSQEGIRSLYDLEIAFWRHTRNNSELVTGDLLVDRVKERFPNR